MCACEPDPQFADLIGRSTRLADDPAASLVRVLAVAVAATAGLAEFQVAARGRACSHLAGYGDDRGTAAGVRFTRCVPTVSVDWLAEQLGPPSFIKVDVEGAEMAVLDGAAGTLRAHRSRLLVEVGRLSAAAVGRRLTAKGYVLTDDAGQTRADVDGYCGDLYAEPAGG